MDNELETLTDGELVSYIRRYFGGGSIDYTAAGGAILGGEIPTKEGVCFRLGCTIGELVSRCGGSVEVMRACEVANMGLKHLVVNGGLSGAMDGSFANHFLQNEHGWSARAENKSVAVHVLSEGDRRMLERAGVEVIDG